MCKFEQVRNGGIIGLRPMRNDMDNCVIKELRERISVEPSVLFWGQNYLASKNGNNAFYDIVNQKLCNGMLPAETDYTAAWSYINDGELLRDDTFESMRKIMQDIPEQPWIRKVLSMRWGMIMTSAFDSIMTNNVGENFSFNEIDLEIKKNFSRGYISKRTVNFSFLCGNIMSENKNELPPYDCTTRGMTSHRKKINDRISWIYNDILPDYGVLVIDGWNPDKDWIKNLLENAGEMQQESIFLFSATSEMLKNEDIAILIDSGILLSDERSFADALDEIGFFDYDSEDLGFLAKQDSGRILTLSACKDDKPIVISFDALARLDSRITVLYDDIWFSKERLEDMEELYAQFQMQIDSPIWHLFNSKYGFYFKRSIDEALLKTVNTELRRNDSYKRQYIMVQGNSNTGKTMSLVHLAYTERNSVPIIYINGEPNQPDWIEHLKGFIKTQFLEKQSGGKWIDSVLVIWDANTDYSAKQRCKHLQDVLRECNAVVVGSAYPIMGACTETTKSGYKKEKGCHLFTLSANLEQDEKKWLLESIKRVNTEIYVDIEKHMAANNYLLDIFQNIVRLEYQGEWRQVADVLKSRFNQEVDVNEDYADEQLRTYKAKMASMVNSEIKSYGVASAWQIKLEEIKKTLQGTTDSEVIPNIIEKLEKYEHMEKQIQIFNSVLAVAGEFSIDLPLTIILRVIHHTNGSIFSDEQLFLLKVISADSLVRYSRDDEGYIKVNFRHACEAEYYVQKNFGGNVDEQKGKEVEILKELIRECRWDDEQESVAVLSLVRGFGPNSWGTITRPRKKGARHYTEFEKWWKEIAEELRKSTQDHFEAILVYALFIRSYCRKEQDKLEASDITDEQKKIEMNKYALELNDSRSILREAIESHDQSNKYQYCRLLGEMCANLVYGMRSCDTSERETRFFHLKDYFAKAVKNWTYNTSQNLFTTNSLLDIWLNGVDWYFKTRIGYSDPMGDIECAGIVADSINYIDILLDLNDENFDNEKLLDKIIVMYDYAGSNKLENIKDNLQKSNNDTFLYLSAWKCWNVAGEEKVATGCYNSKERICNNLSLISDVGDGIVANDTKIGREELILAAQKSLEILESNRQLIENSKSTRCLYIMIKAKWLTYTGHMPLEAKQYPGLTVEQWREIGELCEKYILYADGNNEYIKVMPVLLRMVYVWSFSQNNQEFDNLRNRQNMLRSNDWYFDRICLCSPETGEAKGFYVNMMLKRDSKEKYVAKLVSSECERTSGIRDVIDNNVLGKVVHVPDGAARTIMGADFGSQKNNVDRPVNIWFNAKGPHIYPCNKGTKNNENA